MVKKQNPLLSFVVPVYKKPTEIVERCLRSLRNMSYKNIEIVVVFDGDPDDKAQVKLAQGFTKPELVLTIPHGGAPKARNEGYKLTTGTYVSFFDADCFAKPEMAKRWMEEFESTNADFVYAGYEYTGHREAINGEPFDPYLLTCNNYISTMFPMKREIFPGFDESLKAAQDWDLWLTIVEKGYVGSYIQGYSFVTEPHDRESISGQGWSDENYEETKRIVKEKHGIPDRKMVVGSAMNALKGLHIAKMVNADFMKIVSWRPHKYDLVFILGFGEDFNFQYCKPGCVKVFYWLPWEITGLENYGFLKAVNMLRRSQEAGVVHFCNEIVSQKRLKRLFDYVGIPTPEILPLPSEVDDAETTLPKDYRVLLDIDEHHLPLFKDIKAALPYIRIDELDFKTNPIAEIKDYSLLVSFKELPTIDEAIRRFLINGRNVISNVEAPYCGNVDMQVGISLFKDELIKRIRDGRYLPFNAVAQEHYKKQVDPKVFIERVKALLPAPKLEVLV